MEEMLNGMGLLPKEGACHLLEQDFQQVLAWLDKVDASGYHSMLITRLPARRLLGKVDLNTVEVWWLTERTSAAAIHPSLERLAATLREKMSQKSGIIILDGLEHLMSLHGFAALLTFVRSMSDEIGGTGWRLLMPVEPRAFRTTEIARLRRESSTWTLPLIEQVEGEVSEQEDEEEAAVEVATQSQTPLMPYEQSEDGLARLVHLTRLPRHGFTIAILRRRILAWRRMGLDLSELEAAMKYSDMDRAHALYRVVEEKIRLAVELDRRIDLLEGRGDHSNATAFRFRIRQLTGIQEVWRSLNILLED